MSSSEHPLHRLTVDAPESGLGVLVIDAEGTIVGRCADDQQRLELDLPRGLYTVRSHRSGAFSETLVRLDGPQTVQAAPPPTFSAATIPGAETTHEYYTYPAWEISQQLTAPELAWNGPADARLLVFVRAPQRDAYRGEDQLASLSLRTPDGATLSTFTTDAKRDTDAGWSACSVQLSAGILILQDLGERPRQISVPLLSGWQTQLFVMHSRRILWEDMRLITVPVHEILSRKHRDPYDSQAEDVRAALDMDAGLLALQNGAPSVAPRLIDTFLGSKFQNPMLGLLGAYLLLLRERRKIGEPDWRTDIGYISMVLDNLHTLLPESADVAALRLLAKPWLGQPTLAPVTRMPMFRYGVEVLLREAAADLALVPEGSLLDLVSDRLYGDTVWTSWQPVPLPPGRHIASTPAAEMATGPSWVELAVVDAISAVRDREDGAATDDLLRRIGVSPRVLREAMHRLVARAGTQQEPSELASPDLRLLGGRIARKLADKLGTSIDEGLLAKFPGGFASAEDTPGIRQVYSRLKKALAEVAGTRAGKISADSMLTDIIEPGDAQGRTWLSNRLARQFSEHSIEFSTGELDDVESVRDLARLMVRKLEG
jgi:hypothetical protein